MLSASASSSSAAAAAFSCSAANFSSLSLMYCRIMSIALRTSFFLMTWMILDSCNVSRLTFSGRSSESTTPRMKLRYRGSSSNSSLIKTLRTYSRMPLTLSIMLPMRTDCGRSLGRYRMLLKLIFPSALKWDQVAESCNSSLAMVFQKAWYSSSVMSSLERVQMAGFPFTCSHSKVVTVLVSFGFSSSSVESSTFKSSSSFVSSLSALASASASASASESVASVTLSSGSTSTSMVSTVRSMIGCITNSE
mmetsp:Transcript_27027/g.76037  ORF Transcript_27027/g.76037 Transcript_27027/m.76037 type:complete len:250 (-) Transcript_27027:853-1602(-)